MDKILPRLTPITPFEIYVQRVKGTYDAIRSSNDNMAYIPPQFGGLFGQSAISQAGLVLELTEFEVN